MNVKGSLIAAMWYTLKTTCEGVLNKDMFNPEISQMKAIFEFIPPTKFTETEKAPNKPDEISTFTLQKK